MNMLILDGGPRDVRGAACREIGARAGQAARRRGWDVTALGLDGMSVKPCRGCYACWTKHPGTCAVRDDEELVHRAMAASDVQVWTTPVTFGGYGPALKRALDRSIPNVLPRFIKVRGEIHHPQRYPKRRAFLVFGTLASPDAAAERIFHHLVRRNALNLFSVLTESRVISGGASLEEIDGLVDGALAVMEASR